MKIKRTAYVTALKVDPETGAYIEVEEHIQLIVPGAVDEPATERRFRIPIERTRNVCRPPCPTCGRHFDLVEKGRLFVKKNGTAYFVGDEKTRDIE